jgi:hypothetical protein
MLNSIIFFILSITMAISSAVSFLGYKRFKKQNFTVRTQEIYLLPPPPTPTLPKEPEPETEEITINGIEPEEPISFFRTKKFIFTACTVGLVLGTYLSYLMFFAK